MLASIGFILITGCFFGYIMKRLGLPPLIGMIAVGIISGPNALGLISSELMEISPQIRQTALVIILTRAGLSLDTKDLVKAGRPALLMCFLPAAAEIIGSALLAPMIFGISTSEALLLGSVLAAVSPAVIVPRMIKLIESGYGTEKKIPQIILAGASADDILVIVMFSVFMSMVSGQTVSMAGSVISGVLSVVLGIAVGAGLGMLLSLLFQKISMRDSVKVITLLSASFLLLGIEDIMSDYIKISALIAIAATGIMIKKHIPDKAAHISAKYNKLWIAAEIMLFVLVGAEVDMNAAMMFGAEAVLLVIAALLFRMAGVYLCMLGTKLSLRERLFCMISYLPKATVQAAIGASALSAGLECGELVLTCAVLAILITAPLGAICIDKTYKNLLSNDVNKIT